MTTTNFTVFFQTIKFLGGLAFVLILLTLPNIDQAGLLGMGGIGGKPDSRYGVHQHLSQIGFIHLTLSPTPNHLQIDPSKPLSSPPHLLINVSNKRRTPLRGELAFSPNHRQLVAICQQVGEGGCISEGMEVWSLQKSGDDSANWELTDYYPFEQWSAIQPKWVSDSELQFVKLGTYADESTAQLNLGVHALVREPFFEQSLHESSEGHAIGHARRLSGTESKNNHSDQGWTLKRVADRSPYTATTTAAYDR